MFKKNLFGGFVLVFCLVTKSIATDIVDLAIDSESSSVVSGFSLQADLPGSLIGNYDEVTNPEGTLTLPGLFGGSGNQPVDVDMNGILNGEVNSQPVGGYRLDVDFEELTFSISNLQIDLLGGVAGNLAVELELDFETFRTFQPDSLFLGVPLTLPIGDGSLSVLAFQQSAASLPTRLIPMGPNQYSFTSIVPATITIESDFFGQAIVTPPFDLAVVVNGELQVSGEQVVVTQSFEQMVVDDITDVMDGSFSDIPLPVPTILPPGGTANLLLSGALESISYAIEFSVTLTAEGEKSTVLLGDMNGDGMVNLLDVSLFVDAILNGKLVPEADVNQDGAVNLEDVAPFVELLVGG